MYKWYYYLWFRMRQYCSLLTNGCIGQLSAVTFFARRRKKIANKNLLGEPGVMFTSIGSEYLKKFNISLNAIFTLLFSIIIGATFYGAISPNQAYTLITALLLVTILYASYTIIKTRNEFSFVRLLVILLFFVTFIVACFYVLLTNLATV